MQTIYLESVSSNKMQLNKQDTIFDRKHSCTLLFSYFNCNFYVIVFTGLNMNVYSQANDTIKPISYFIPPKNIWKFYDFLMFLKVNVLKGNIEAWYG